MFIGKTKITTKKSGIRKYKLSIALDIDDVLMECVPYAIRLANEKYQYENPLRLDEITSWENTGRTSVIKEFYFNEELYRRQVVTEKTKKCIRKLMEMADVRVTLPMKGRIESLNAAVAAAIVMWQMKQE